jgi:hypothetical protein
MTQLGSPCGHEAFFQPGGVVPQPALEGDSSWLVGGRAVPTAVLVRNPINVVSSLLGTSFLRDKANPYTNYCYKVMPQIAALSNRLERIVAYVSSWDKRMAANPEVAVYRIEDLVTAEAVAEFYRRCTGRGPAGRSGVQEVLTMLGRKINTHRTATKTWADIDRVVGAQELVDKAKTYRYLEGR